MHIKNENKYYENTLSNIMVQIKCTTRLKYVSIWLNKNIQNKINSIFIFEKGFLNSRFAGMYVDVTVTSKENYQCSFASDLNPFLYSKESKHSKWYSVSFIFIVVNILNKSIL